MTVTFTAYVAGDDMAAAVTQRIGELCAGRAVEVDITVVDVKADPAAAESVNVIALPTVVRESPFPRKRVIGQLDDDRRCAEALGLDAYPVSVGGPA